MHGTPHPACKEYISENEMTTFYEPSMSFNEFGDYKVIVGMPKNEAQAPAFLLINKKTKEYIYHCQNAEQMFYKLKILERLSLEPFDSKTIGERRKRYGIGWLISK